jgi:hypothetical protein
MKKRLTLASSSFTALLLVMPAVSGAQGRHPSSEGTATGGSAVSRDGDSGAPASSGGGSMSSSPAPSVPLPAVPRATAPADGGRVQNPNATRRSRGDRPQTGVAQARTRPINPSSPSYGYSTSALPYWWYSSYAPGFSYDFWSWGFRPDSLWGSPFGYGGYSPYGYRPYGYGGYGGYGYGYGYADPYGPIAGGGSYSGYDDDADDTRPSGGIRLRVDPAEARVYVDGALVGLVDEFDGLANHLELDPGAHQIELRAAGYEPYVTEVSVREGKTITTRAHLKKLN